MTSDDRDDMPSDPEPAAPGVAAVLLAPSRVATGVLAIVAVAFVVGAWRLGFWDQDGPGPGLLPFIAAVALLGLLVLMQREPVGADETPFRIRPLIGIALCAAYAGAAPWTGFVPATLVLVAGWVRIFHGEPWTRCVLLAAVLTGAAILLFGTLLRVPMPLFPVLS